MSFSHSLFLVLVFAVVVAITWVAIRQLVPSTVQRRVDALADGPTQASAQGVFDGLPKVLARLLQPLARASLPQQAWEKTPLRVRFYNAGLRGVAAPVVYFGAKTLLTFALPVLLMVVLWFSGAKLTTTPLLVSLLLLAGIGYYLPNAALAHMISRRQRELFEAFPDALDLMRVCVESGLGMDAAIDRVGREMALESPALSEEFHLVSLELRAGASRADALRSLALRVALEDIDALTSMLVQADRFGTSVSESLRVHSGSLRNKRRLIAEEAAAKLPVKLLVPLIFCVFPALLTVLLGPAVISVYRILIPRLAGQ
ncbi:type II secretion system F family protein [Caenimonas sp. SL110]|uniref:type II secretion system F family protein n=1 Tax=Caenimonas sp. SL110 TaxID=1450524 RepID=UPI0006542147|nr:type II secretion system F family protein [Caenimonas sp. SL110]